MSENCISKALVEEKARKIDNMERSLKKQDANVKLLGVIIEQLEEIQDTVQKILGSFSGFDTKENASEDTKGKICNFNQLKELIKITCENAKNEIEAVNQTREEIGELLSYTKKEKETDALVGALEIIARDTKDSGLAKNLEGLIFYVKENGTGNDSITLLSRASWKY